MVTNIIKFGGSVITNRTSPDFFDARTATRLSAELYPCYKNSILIHGTGLVGKPPAVKYGYVETGIIRPKDQSIALQIKSDIRRLNQHMIRILLAASIPALPFDILHFYDHPKEQWDQPLMNRILTQLLENGVVPVFFGDLLPQADGSFRVFSSDLIAMELTRLLRPKNVFFLTDVDGVFSEGNNGRLMNILSPTELHLLKRSEQDKTDVSGGMYQKARMALEIARHCEKCFIGNGRSKDILRTLLKGGDPLGTLVMPH